MFQWQAEKVLLRIPSKKKWGLSVCLRASTFKRAFARPNLRRNYMKIKTIPWVLALAGILAIVPAVKAADLRVTASGVDQFDGTGPTPNPIPMGPHAFDGTGPTPNPIPMGPHAFDGTGPTPNPIPMGPHAFDGTGPTPNPIPMGPHAFDGTGPTPNPIPMGPHAFDGTGPTPNPIPMGPHAISGNSQAL